MDNEIEAMLSLQQNLHAVVVRIPHIICPDPRALSRLLPDPGS
jgi:hypothetical protein